MLNCKIGFARRFSRREAPGRDGEVRSRRVTSFSVWGGASRCEASSAVVEARCRANRSAYRKLAESLSEIRVKLLRGSHLRPTIESLPEVLEGVAGKVPMIVDGGIRRGTDIFKALALGATAVGIGRPYAWGLAAFGQPGVEAVLEIPRRELRTIMRQAGTTSVDKITRRYVVARPGGG